MGKTIWSAGQVVKGDYEGRYVYKQDDSSYIIVSGDDNGKIVQGFLLSTPYQKLKVISSQTVDHYEEAGSVKKGPDVGAVANGLFWLGPVGGVLGAVASQSSTTDIAVYFKDGKKSLLKLNASAAQELKRILFSF